AQGSAPRPAEPVCPGPKHTRAEARFRGTAWGVAPRSAARARGGDALAGEPLPGERPGYSCRPAILAGPPFRAARPEVGPLDVTLAAVVAHPAHATGAHPRQHQPGSSTSPVTRSGGAWPRELPQRGVDKMVYILS